MSHLEQTRPNKARTVSLLVAEHGAPFPARARREGLEYDDFVAVAQAAGESSTDFAARLKERITRLTRQGARPLHAALSLGRLVDTERPWQLLTVLATALARGGGGVLELQSCEPDAGRVRALAENLKALVAREVTILVGQPDFAAA